MRRWAFSCFLVASTAIFTLAGCTHGQELYSPTEQGDFDWENATTIQSGSEGDVVSEDVPAGDEEGSDDSDMEKDEEATTTVLDKVVTKIVDINDPPPDEELETVITSYAFDSSNRLETVEVQSPTKNYKSTFTYDNEDRIVHLLIMDEKKNRQKESRVFEYDDEGRLSHFYQTIYDTSASTCPPTCLVINNIRIDYEYDPADPLTRNAKIFDNSTVPPTPIGNELATFLSKDLFKATYVADTTTTPDEVESWTMTVEDHQIVDISGADIEGSSTPYVQVRKEMQFSYQNGDGLPEEVQRTDTLLSYYPPPTRTYRCENPSYDRKHLIREVCRKYDSTYPRFKFEREFTYKDLPGKLNRQPAITLPTEFFYGGRVTLLYANDAIRYFLYPFERMDRY